MWKDNMSGETIVNVAKVNILAEHERQIRKHGHQECDAGMWMLFLMEEVGELSTAIQDRFYKNAPREDISAEAIQVATLAIKIAMMASG